MRGPFLDLAAAKLAFNQGIASVRQMQYDVRLKAVPVPIVGNVTILIHRVGTKVTHTHLLEQKPNVFSCVIRISGDNPKAATATEGSQKDLLGVLLMFDLLLIAGHQAPIS